MLRAADAVVVPVIPSPLSLRMVERLQQFVTEAGWHGLRILTLQTLPAEPDAPRPQVAERCGFSLHAGIAATAPRT